MHPSSHPPVLVWLGLAAAAFVLLARRVASG
jgi:hypothetical protein